METLDWQACELNCDFSLQHDTLHECLCFAANWKYTRQNDARTTCIQQFTNRYAPERFLYYLGWTWPHIAWMVVSSLVHVPKQGAAIYITIQITSTNFLPMLSGVRIQRAASDTTMTEILFMKVFRFRFCWFLPSGCFIRNFNTCFVLCFLTHPHLCHFRIRSNKRMLLLVGGLPPGPDRLPSNLVQYYDDEKKTWKILTSE